MMPRTTGYHIGHIFTMGLILYFRSSGYKSDSSQSRPKSNQTRTITLSSLSDAETEQYHHRRKMTIIEETKKRAGKTSKLSNVEEQLFTSKTPLS